ncbi:hypothetical protein B9T34_11910 [Acinetobacter sp. ANC 3813]|nr:Ig-like domain-containing protein [Acinetobacter sp. ANC 3813]OTG89373.1 hypothetical protein B9T34_11910 [Acinetobacter sp. ANC 3813]
MDKKQIVLKLSAVSIAVLLASCGGGGSDGYYNQQQSGSNSGPSTNPNTGEAVKSLNASAIQLKDLNGNSIAVITAEGVTATVKVTDQSGNGVSGALVTFSSSGGVVFGSSNGAVVTNANGEAIISVTPQDASSTGAYKISATAEYDGNTANAKDATFTLQSLNVTLSNLAAAVTSLASGASTNITLKTLNDSSTAQNNVTVNFTASCGTFDPASVISSNQGNVITSYKAIASNGDLCEGPVVVTASSPSSSSSVTTTLNIAAVAADSLVYTTATDVNLGIKSSGSAASSSIEFTLYANGVPARDKDVEVSLEKAPNDLHFVTLNNRAVQTLKSDSKGKIVVNLYPGNIPGPVEIKATLVASPSVSAISKGVKVSSGRVTQEGVSLSVSKQSLRTDIDGDVSTIVARMVDRTGNPVPKDTVISFVSEGGKVDPNCMTDDKGVCSVTLTTQSPRPLDNRVTVLAYVEGDKDYNDIDGDNLYTAGTDILTENIGDFFRDDDENTLYTVGEFLYKKAAGALQCLSTKPTPTPLIVQPNIPNTCDNNLSGVLRQQILFAFAHDTPTYVWGSGFDSNGFITSGSGNFSFQVFGNSQKTVPMPSGTQISVEVKDNTDANNLSCEAVIREGNVTVPTVMELFTPSTFGKTNNEVVSYIVRLKGCATGDDVKVISSVPSGKTVTSWLDIK